MSDDETDAQVLAGRKKKSVALSGTVAGNTSICTVGRSGNDLHYRGYDILDFADSAGFEEIAHLLIHGTLPGSRELAAYKERLKSMRGLPGLPTIWAPSSDWGITSHARRPVRAGRP